MKLIRFFRERAGQQQPLVLVTVIETRGSTYSKSGDQMLIDADGNFQGMLSGGCLEGDLVEHARGVIATGAARIVEYDLGADDEVWGLGVGCDGSMRLLLQALTADGDYQPFAAMAEILAGESPAIVAIVVEADRLPAGVSLLQRNGEIHCFGLQPGIEQQLFDAYAGAPGLVSIELETGQCGVLFKHCRPAPSLLILGAGLDAEPLARFAVELGWRCAAVDHRPSYIEERCFPESVRTLCCGAAELSQRVDLKAFDMAIVMSHHLASDRVYLEQLAESAIAYIGLLGPAGRRDRLLAELGDTAHELHGRLHGPAGIKLGGRGPAPIALEIVAGLQRFLAERD